MYLKPLQPIENSEIRVCGDVQIHPSASIAPGVILQATSGSKILIGADACIGMGVIVSACSGLIEIDNGVTLGSGVLFIGQGKIGSNACIGTATTIINASVDAMKVVNPGSLIGDSSRQLALDEKNQDKEDFESQKPTQEISNNGVASKETQDLPNVEQDLELNGRPETDSNSEVVRNEDPSDPWKESEIEDLSSEFQDDVIEIAVKEVKNSLNLDDKTTIGKVYIDELLVTLFPHKKHIYKRLDQEKKQNQE